MTDDAQWFVGVDWASRAHQACLVDAGGTIVSEEAFAHGGAGFVELCTWLVAKTGAAPTAIATRFSRCCWRMPARLPLTPPL